MLDGHGSHINPEFDQFCLDHKIIIIYIPAHSSHLLQPLDVGCFSALKQAYRRSVKQLISRGINHVNKYEFLPLYRQARQTALHQSNIRAGFAATGLVLYNPDYVLSQLHAEYQTPSPQRRPPSSASWAAETPHNITKLQKQTVLLKRYLKQRTHSPPSPTEQALGQLVKGCKMAMSNAVLLASENEKLYMESQCQKRKRAKKRMYIAEGGVLLGAKGASRAQAAQEGVAAVAVEAAAERPQRAPRKCSMCNLIEHTARTCLDVRQLPSK